MLRAFRNNINENDLFFRDEKILLAVSGGVDSVVMLDLFHRLEMDCVIAHCNFNLRGDESDGDEAFVRELSEKYNYPLFVINFQTKEYASQHGISIEMAARDLRYNWFETMRLEQKCSCVAVAHHSDDVAETLFINLCRGTGIRGLTGIKPKTGSIVRPLLNLSRPQLEAYAKERGLAFREDSTNAQVEYVRNKIRHKVLPVLEMINPSIRQTLMDNIEHFREVEKIYLQAVKEKRAELVVKEDEQTKISISGLKSTAAPATFLFEILAPFNFHFRDVQHMAKALDSISGKVFYSSTHRVIRDREFLLVLPLENTTKKEYQIERSIQKINMPFAMSLKFIDSTDDFVFPSHSHIACLDAGKLQFPLTLRKWRQGDTFTPLGMKGKKKLSDFFIDQKFSMNKKENIWLLVSGDDIVWVVGHRMDDRFKITRDTQQICKLSLTDPNM